MELYWRLFTNCTSQQAPLKVAARMFEQAGLEVSNLHAEPYHKGGFMVSACSIMPRNRGLNLWFLPWLRLSALAADGT